MNKLFNALLKPAKLIFVIGAFVFAGWFAVSKAGSMSGSFMSVMTNLILLIVGTALLAAAPIFILIKKENLAKIAFCILVGYWVLSEVQNLFLMAEVYTYSGSDGLEITMGIFAFLFGLALLGVLALVILEFALKKPIFRFINYLVFAGVVLFAFVYGLLAFIHCCNYNLGWVSAVDLFIGNIILPTIIFFGCLFFFGAPEVPEKAAPAKVEEKPAEEPAPEVATEQAE